jgi:hypothetical protein
MEHDMSLAEELAKGGGKFLAWEYPGTMYEGMIKGVDMRQAREYQSTTPATWDDGTPKMQCVLTLATQLRDPQDPEDDGTRQISINLWSGQKAALVKACKAAGVPEPQVGQMIRATHVSGMGTAQSPRVFEYQLGPAPAAGGGLQGALGGQPPAQQPPVQQQFAPPAPAFQPPAQPPVQQQQWGTADPWQGQQPQQLQQPPVQQQFAPPAPPLQAPPLQQVPQPTYQPAAPNAGEHARSLLAQGMAVPDVAQQTGLPSSSVAALAASMQQPAQPPF